MFTLSVWGPTPDLGSPQRLVRQRVHGSLFNRTLEGLARVASMMRATRASNPDGYLLASYRIAPPPSPNSSRPTSFKSIPFDSPANNVGPWPASLGCTT